MAFGIIPAVFWIAIVQTIQVYNIQLYLDKNMSM